MNAKIQVFKMVCKALAVVIALVCCYNMFYAIAENEQVYTECWVLCQPNDCVNIRETPSRKGQILGRFETGDKIYIDGKHKNGFLHLVKLGLEMSEGWIYCGYVSTEEPKVVCATTTVQANGRRVACRKHICGERRCWVVTGTELTVWYWTDEWAVTNKGFIQSKYLAPVSIPEQ